MFNKKSVVKMLREGKHFRSETSTAKLNDAQLLSCLKGNFDKYGELVITDITDNEITITTNQTLEHRSATEKLQNLHDLIYDFISES